MQRFTYDILHDVTEDTEIIESTELVHSIQIPAYASDEQRKELFLEIMDAVDDVSFTEQRLRMDVGKEFVTIRRELGGGWIHQEDDDDAFQVTQSMTGVMNELNTAINEELDDIRNKQDETD